MNRPRWVVVIAVATVLAWGTRVSARAQDAADADSLLRRAGEAAAAFDAAFRDSVLEYRRWDAVVPPAAVERLFRRQVDANAVCTSLEVRTALYEELATAYDELAASDTVYTKVGQTTVRSDDLRSIEVIGRWTVGQRDALDRPLPLDDPARRSRVRTSQGEALFQPLHMRELGWGGLVTAYPRASSWATTDVPTVLFPLHRPPSFYADAVRLDRVGTAPTDDWVTFRPVGAPEGDAVTIHACRGLLGPPARAEFTRSGKPWIEAVFKYWVDQGMVAPLASTCVTWQPDGTARVRTVYVLSLVPQRVPDSAFVLTVPPNAMLMYEGDTGRETNRLDVAIAQRPELALVLSMLPGVASPPRPATEGQLATDDAESVAPNRLLDPVVLVSAVACAVLTVALLWVRRLRRSRRQTTAVLLLGIAALLSGCAREQQSDLSVIDLGTVDPGQAAVHARLRLLNPFGVEGVVDRIDKSCACVLTDGGVGVRVAAAGVAEIPIEISLRGNAHRLAEQIAVRIVAEGKSHVARYEVRCEIPIILDVRPRRLQLQATSAGFVGEAVVYCTSTEFLREVRVESVAQGMSAALAPRRTGPGGVEHRVRVVSAGPAFNDERPVVLRCTTQDGASVALQAWVVAPPAREFGIVPPILSIDPTTRAATAHITALDAGTATRSGCGTWRIGRHSPDVEATLDVGESPAEPVIVRVTARVRGPWVGSIVLTDGSRTITVPLVLASP